MFDHRKNSNTKFAYDLAKRLHDGQRDKDDKDYFNSHVIDVAKRVYNAHLRRDIVDISPYNLATISLLHDVLEDTVMTEDVLRGIFDEWTVDAVTMLTRGKEQSYEDYIAQVCQNRFALEVKIHDIHSNLDPQRLHRLDASTQVRLVKKYTKALKDLYVNRLSDESRG